MGIADEADRTLFVGNLDPKVTEELLFELFLQAGPMIKVKIPKDNDGKQKQFGFVNFRHEVSVPYGMELLNGTMLYGRPLKIQFRAGSSHVSQEGNSPNPSLGNRGGRTPDQMGSPSYSPPQHQQRPFSSPDSLQRQALMNNMFQVQMQHLSGGFPGGFQQRHSINSPWQQDGSSPRGHRSAYMQESSGGHHGREQRYVDSGAERHPRASRADHYQHDDRSGRTRDYPERRRDGAKEGRYRRY